MTITGIVVEAVLVTLAQATLVCCVIAFVVMCLIVAGRFIREGRGMESVWPDGLESQEADIPSPTDPWK